MLKKTQIKNIAKNDYYIKILKNLFAGNNSETILTLQSFYYYENLTEFDTEFLSVFDQINSQDFNHQQLLSRCIISAGGDTTYTSGNGVCISGNLVDYTKSKQLMLENLIEKKENLIIDYKLAISQIKSHEIVNVLQLILTEEYSHKEMLVNLKEKYF